MQKVAVQLSAHPYEVLVGEDLLETAGEKIAEAGLGGRCVIVTDSTVGPLYAEALFASLARAGFAADVVTVPAGEGSKSMSQAEEVCREMIRHGHDRSSFVVALGGGVVGDLAGFCAAIFFRGVPYVQIPTTIVSQVDSSVGGKTGVNTSEGKNLLGAFHQPKLVLADPRTLLSLPAREYNEGFAEIIKHAAIRDGQMLEALPAPENRAGLESLIARNVGIKAAVVEEDEKELSGTRALLNFGHTIGHGIEAAGGYGRFLHGEAISLGLVAACGLSEKKAGLDDSVTSGITGALETFGLPLKLEGDLDTSAVLQALKHDKKFRAGSIAFVLLRAAGDAFVSRDVTLEEIEAAIEGLRA
ncbi:MAG: 3-dehydroquinate synthase [Verrucomicrobiota bacterium]